MEQWDVDSLTFEESGRGQKVAALLITEFLSVALVYVTPRRVKRSPSFSLSARTLRSRRGSTNLYDPCFHASLDQLFVEHSDN